MPNYYAHLIFGREVLAQLPPVLRGQLEGERGAFDIGLYGPDPLFCYHPMTRNFARITGLSMHKEPVRPVAERLLQAVEDDLPYARGYAAGFLCHFALDSCCHYYIEEQHARGLSHAGMEAELERALMLADGIDPLHETPMLYPELPDVFYETATAAAYPGVRPDQLRKGLRGFRRFCRLQTRAAGTRVHRFTNWAGRRSSHLSRVRGTILSPSPDPAYTESTQVLLSLLHDEVASTAAELTRFFAVVARGGVLDDWYDRPFSGQWRAEQELVPQAAAR
ncbi:MAG: zinc dependent phospholipase C family protein [Pseudoflavonifractor sp.]|nr:zinc dependent phospholipase C family protein [Pseudoflavonifractor sp.]